MPDLSIIIPVYNASSYIIEAVESVLNQHVISTEIILIDDGSTDNSVDLIMSHFSTENIIIYRKSNGGAGSARNFGLKKATGDFIMFLDADDYLTDNNICNNCIKNMIKNNLDLFLFSYKYENVKSNNVTIPWLYPEIRSNEEYPTILFKLISSGIFPASPCYRIIRRSFLIENDIKFREQCNAEDIDWFIKTLIHTQKIGIINNDCYIYRKGINSSVTSVNTDKQCLDLLNAIKESVVILNKKCNNPVRHILLSAITYQYCILLSNIYSSGEFEKYKKELLHYKYLFRYKLFPNVKYIALLSHIAPLKVISKLLYYYKIKYAKSLN